jgi:hypothetical protein
MTALRSERCGGFVVHGAADALETDDDAALVLRADHDYAVTLPAGSAELPLAGALRRLPGASEAVLRFSGFIGDTKLGGRRVRVRSPKLTPRQVEWMLDAVAGRLAVLPFAFATPVGAAYARDAPEGPDIAYQAAVLIFDALRGRGRHDLGGAMDRILARPYTVLAAERAEVPLPLADRLGPSSLLDAITTGHLSPVLPRGHALASTPAAMALGGRVPQRLTVERVHPEHDNAENRFVKSVLEACIRSIHVVAGLARASNAPGAMSLLRDCARATEALEHWRRHRVLEPLRPRGPAPLLSTVLQHQPGYRDVLAFWMDLIGRTRRLPPRHSSALLALRDAPTLYEYWCYFEVVAAAEISEGSPVSTVSPDHDEGAARLAWSSVTSFASGASVVFNERFRGRHAAGAGPRSASVALRPDIVLRPASGGFHVLDAKFRLTRPTVDAVDEGSDDAAKHADIHKMHAYRDALGARSAWVMFPGGGEAAEFAPHGRALEPEAAPLGVGTIPHRPGSAGGALRGVVARMLQG